MRLDFFVRRTFHLVITTFIVLTLIFIIFQAMPGSPEDQLISPSMNKEAIAQLREQFGLDEPLYIQYGKYMWNMLTFNFGYSFFGSVPVWDIIQQKVPPTLLLFGTSVLSGYAIAIVWGTSLAWRRGTTMEVWEIFIALIFYSMPVFWFGILLLWALAGPQGAHNYIPFVDEPLFPLGGLGGLDPDTGEALPFLSWSWPFMPRWMDILWHMALPLISLKILSVAGGALLMRNSMLEVLGEDYITTAKAKGLSERQVMFKHAARNATLPMVTSMALALGGIISGGVLTETIFSWPGMGLELISATIRQDFPVVFALFYIMALMTIIANFAADMLYAYLDPRVRL